MGGCGRELSPWQPTHKHGMAMAARWLAEVREQVQLSEGWQEYCKELVDVVLQQLAEGHVNSFTDLSASEKTLFVDRAAKAINEGSVYKTLVNRIGSTLEKQICRHLVGKIQESKPVQTRNEAFQSHIQDVSKIDWLIAIDGLATPNVHLECDRSHWRLELRRGLKRGEEKLRLAAEEKRTHRKNSTKTTLEDSAFKCSRCSRDCHSCVGLYSHYRRCSNTD
ncbi:uncharacterized protein LOC134336647 isoform X4 [Mobula hypostoma]|uniref:uncharacterized protein LOC134336647 isoform X4 n=1 Tax=Mobula hypostoma TaxID=723540 RepID=UPI002FC2F6B0